jgi:hypothetical protein
VKRKVKDVKLMKSVARKSRVKKSADSLPKILDMAQYNGSLQQQWVRCGKDGCKCSRGQLHGPYFYLFISMSDGLLKAYVRRNDVPIVRAIIAERKHIHSSFRYEVRHAFNLLRQMAKATVGVRK